MAQSTGKKSFIACGENSNRLLPGAIPYTTGLMYHGWRNLISKVNGIICVSTENMKLLLSTGFIDEEIPTVVIPNG